MKKSVNNSWCHHQAIKKMDESNNINGDLTSFIDECNGYEWIYDMSVSEIGVYHLKLWHFECAPHGDDPIGVGRLLSQTRNSDSQGLRMSTGSVSVFCSFFWPG